MLRPYEVIAPLSVYEVLQSLPRGDRRQVEEFLRGLTRHPSLSGDFDCPAEDGRTHCVKTVGNWLVSYWPDHAAREIRLSAIEPIE